MLAVLRELNQKDLSPPPCRRHDLQLQCCRADRAGKSCKADSCARLCMQTLVMLLALKFIAWLVEVGGLLSLHKCASITKSQAILCMNLAEGPSSGRRSILQGSARMQCTIQCMQQSACRVLAFSWTLTCPLDSNAHPPHLCRSCNDECHVVSLPVRQLL